VKKRRPQATRGALRIHLHAQARFVAEHCRRLLFQLTRSILHHIPVASKQELNDRIMAAMDSITQHPVVHTWSYKLEHLVTPWRIR
jgi:hypothetical protein